LNAARVLLLLLLAAAMPVPATAQTAPPRCPKAPATFPFAPPAGPQRYIVETERPVRSGGVRRFALEYRVQFHRDADGQSMTATLLRSDVPDALAAGSAMTAIFAPLVGRPLVFHYDATSRRLLLRQADADALWKQLADDMVARAHGAAPGEARGVAAMLLDLPVGQRETILFADLGKLFSFAGQAPGPGLTVRPGGRSGDCSVIEITGQEGWAHGGPGYVSQTLWLIDAASGLLREQREDVTHMEGTGDKAVLAVRTLRRLAPE
jgi:hypothetical protein